MDRESEQSFQFNHSEAKKFPPVPRLYRVRALTPCQLIELPNTKLADFFTN